MHGIYRITSTPDSKVHGANMGGPHVGPMKFAVWDIHPQSMLYWYYTRGNLMRQANEYRSQYCETEVVEEALKSLIR